ncbi:AraC family transcriptional regulator [Paenibacillus sp. sgz500992]|uniref:AraC family transcriptional regulator n=1 Tax=Paenibacillus sp. sgz500992 TaxID=3242476 RepID=UPI0036D23B03
MPRLKLSRLNFLKQRSTFIKIIIYFVSANIIVLAVSFIALYSLSSKTLLKEIGDHSESLLVNGAKNTAQLMEWSINYAYSSSSDVQIESYALSEQHSDLDTYAVWSRLMNIKKGNPSIDSVYLINDYTQQIIDSRLGVNEFDSFYDQEVLQRLRTRKLTDGAFLIPRTLLLPLESGKEKKVITAIVPYETGKSISAFVLNVDADNIMTLLQKNSNVLETSVFVLNDKKELVFSTVKLDAEQIQEFSQAVEKETNGWKIVKPQKSPEQMLVYANTSINGIQNWRFIETIPKSIILSKITWLRNLTLLLFAGLFAASLWVIILLSKRVYSPIQELVHNVMEQHHAEQLDGQNEANELVYLSQVFVSQNERIHELTEHGRKNKFLARERFIRELLGGLTLSIAEIRNNCSELGIELSEEGVSVAIFRIDQFASFTVRYSEKDQRLLRFAMANIIQESLQTDVIKGILTVDMGKDHVAVILPVGRGQSAAMYAGKLQQAQRLVAQFLSIGTTVACGKHLEGLNELHEGYMEAYETTQERFRLGQGAFVIEEYADASPAELYHMPLELERQMVQAIHRADASAFLDSLYMAISSLRERPYFECKMSLITLFMEIRRSMQEITHQPVLPSSWSLTSVENQIIKLETLEAVVEWMAGVSAKFLDEIAAVRSVSRNAGLVGQVEQLIEAHLTDANLSVKMLSDELGLSVNYIRNLYKNETNRSITETISEKRLSIICEELISSEAPIEPIVLKYGFSSLNTFYIAFKKRYGVTPAVYRKSNQK